MLETESRVDFSGNAVECSTIDAHVADYYKTGDASAYEHHFFVVNVRVEDLAYSVHRSYVDFVDLDRRLRKKYPSTNIMTLPLDGAQDIEKAMAKDKSDRRRSAPASGRESLVSIRESIVHNPTFDPAYPGSPSRVVMVKDRYREDFSAKVRSLDNYVVGLLTHHEVVASDELLLFLDEEASSMRVDPQSLEPLSVHDLLLLNEPVHQSVVRRAEEHSFKIRATQLILWRFNTSDYDIGFCVAMNGETKVAMTRHKSHEKVICGILEANQNAVCTLKWDNSYAKLRSKHLNWSARVVTMEEYQVAKAQTLEVQREKKKFESQRHALKRRIVHHAALLSGVIYNSSIVSEHAQEENKRVKELEENLARMELSLETCQKDLQNYHIDMDNAQIEMDEMEKAKQHAEEALEQMQQSWSFTVSQLDTIQEDFRDAQRSNSELTNAMKDMRKETATLASSLKKATLAAKQAEEREREMADACQAALEQGDRDLLNTRAAHDLAIQQLQATHQQHLATHTEMVEELQGQKDQLQAQHALASEQGAAHAQQADEAARARDQLQLQVAECQAALATTDLALQAQRETAATHTAALEASQQAVAGLKRIIDELEQKNAITEAQLAASAAQTAAFRVAIGALRNPMQSLLRLTESST